MELLILKGKACCLDQLQSIQPEDLNVTISPDSQSCPTDSKFMDNFGIKRTCGTDNLFVIIDPVWVATVGDPSAVYITEEEVIGCVWLRLVQSNVMWFEAPESKSHLPFRIPGRVALEEETLPVLGRVCRIMF